MTTTLARLSGCAIGAAVTLLGVQLLTANTASAAPAGSSRAARCSAVAFEPANTGAAARGKSAAGSRQPGLRCTEVGTERRDPTRTNRRDPGSTGATGSTTGSTTGNTTGNTTGATTGDTARQSSGDMTRSRHRAKLSRRDRVLARLTPAAAPTASDGSCAVGRSASPSVTVPSDQRVSYHLDGRRVTAGTYPVSVGVHVVRVVGKRVAGVHGRLLRSTVILVTHGGRCAQPGSHQPAHAPADSEVPVGHAVRCAAADAGPGRTVTAPAGCSPATSRVTNHRADSVVRAVRSAASLTGRALAPCGSSCLGPVVPVAASFTDDTCVASTGQRSGASYTIPATRGVLYWVNGTNVAAGTYPARDGSTVTVVTSARSGFTLSGITQWTHTFSDAPTCSGVETAPKNTSPVTGDPDGSASQRTAPDATRQPASTGAPVGGLLTGALILLVLGVATCLAGARRPRPARTASGAIVPGDVSATDHGVGILARPGVTRSPDVSLTDPAAGSGRTPPRPDLAVGQRVRTRFGRARFDPGRPRSRSRFERGG